MRESGIESRFPAVSEPTSTGRPRILVVEDDPDLLKMLELVMRTLGDVVTATDGMDALAKLTAGPPPDVVITDLAMPRLDGLALAQRIKSMPGLARVPIVILTARTTPCDVIAGINAGARFYVTKPFKTEELLAKVRRALGQRR